MKQSIQKKNFFQLNWNKKNFKEVPFNKEKSFLQKRLWKVSHRNKNKALQTGRLMKPNKKERAFLNSKGQGLIEYLILVALMGVATIAIIRTLNQTVKSRFANSIYALQGRNQKAKTHSLRKEEYQRSDLSNFMTGSASTDKKKNSKK